MGLQQLFAITFSYIASLENHRNHFTFHSYVLQRPQGQLFLRETLHQSRRRLHHVRFLRLLCLHLADQKHPSSWRCRNAVRSDQTGRPRRRGDFGRLVSVGPPEGGDVERRQHDLPLEARQEERRLEARRRRRSTLRVRRQRSRQIG